MISLVIEGVDGGEHHVGAVILDGSPRVAGSLEELRPGEVARIKSRGVAMMTPDAAHRVVAAGRVRVRAVLTWKDGPVGGEWKPVISANAIPIVFRFRR